MLCSCHDAEAYWQKDARRKAGGYWACAVERRRQARELYAANRDKRAASKAAYYHDRGGWLKKRRRDLSAQRQATLDLLGQLQREAETLVES